MPNRVGGLSLSRRTLFEAAAAGAIAGAVPLAGARAAEPIPVALVQNSVLREAWAGCELSL